MSRPPFDSLRPFESDVVRPSAYNYSGPSAYTHQPAYAPYRADSNGYRTPGMHGSVPKQDHGEAAMKEHKHHYSSMMYPQGRQ